MINLKDKLDEECKKEFPRSYIIIEILNDKIIPDQKTMNYLINKFIKSDYIQEEDENSENKICYYDKKKYACFRKEKIANILCQYGYVPSKKDVLDLAKIKCEFNVLPNEYFVDKKFVDELQEICYENKKYMYYKYLLLNKFKNLLISKSDMTLTMLKNLIIEHNIIPDVETIKIACKFKNSYYLIKYLIEKYNIIPNIECLINCNKSNKTAIMLGKKYCEKKIL